MENQLALRLAAGFGFFAVALGAFGAHGMKEILDRHGTSAIWETAVLYHFAHALALLFLSSRSKIQWGPFVSFAVGIVIFSGSLYLLAVTNMRWLGAITPLGGISFLVGWFWLALKPRS